MLRAAHCASCTGEAVTVRFAGTFVLQAWLAWGVSATLPFLISRNPFVLAVASLMVVAVALARADTADTGIRPGLIVRSVGIITLLAVLFNVLTARTGNQVILTVPERFRFLAGPITWNAVVYGVLAAWSIAGLITVWATVGRNLRWASLARLMPERLTGFAVAGSTAINLIPQTAQAIAEIREATSVRGYAPSGARGVVTLVGPTINGGLDRSMRMAEVLEARGFGSRSPATYHSSISDQLAWVALLGGAFLGIYGFSAGGTWPAWAGLLTTVAGTGWLRLRREPERIRRTRYLIEQPTRGDWLVILASVASGMALVVVRQLRPDGFQFEPYPDIVVPAADLLALAPLFLLLAPAFVGTLRDTRID